MTFILQGLMNLMPMVDPFRRSWFPSSRLWRKICPPNWG